MKIEKVKSVLGQNPEIWYYEPTTGLRFQYIKLLLGVLNALIDKGNTVLFIEHNLNVIKVADHIIDIGSEGGE